LLAAVGLLAACTAPGGAPPRSAFRPTVSNAPPPPDVADQQAAELARAALLSDRDHTERVLKNFEAIETVLAASDEPPTGLMPIAIDLHNTTLDDRRAYRAASKNLLKRKDLDAAIRARLEYFRDDAPLELASDRIRDAWVLAVGRAFNTLAEPVGQSIMTFKLAPYRLGRSLLDYAVHVYSQEKLTLQHRQALVHWKEFLKRNPDAAEVESIEPKVRSYHSRFLMLQRDRSLKVARAALSKNRVRLALVYADRALRFVPEDRAAAEVRDEAAERLIEVRERESSSVAAAPGDPLGGDAEQSRALAVALLAPDGDPAALARALREADPEGPLADEARYIEAIGLGENGDDDEMWRILEDLADADPEDSNMGRHAAVLVSDPNVNTWGAFESAKRTNLVDQTKFVFLGPFFRGMPDRGLPGPLEWLVGAPSLAESMFATPVRLINAPWMQQLPSEHRAAIAGQRHLEHHPQGFHSQDTRDWLIAYQKERGNWMGALVLAEGEPDPDLTELAELRERAAEQYLNAALAQRSVAMRIGMYQKLGAIYPGSQAARVAGDLARMEMERTTVQSIRLSREFLLENRDVAGPDCLGLRPELIDGDATNSELHPAGITLAGSQLIQVHYLAPSGDEDDPPVDRIERVDEEHLARIVSQLEETSYRKMLEDPLEAVGPDPRRDLYFERARLGLASDIDRRPGSISQYTYQGLRERYGMVRAREPILPFDLVVQGNIRTLSLGAFPRIRPPKETPDAILYR
jgi:tetratricopeptide (TPR) repeat protein